MDPQIDFRRYRLAGWAGLLVPVFAACFQPGSGGGSASGSASASGTATDGSTGIVSVSGTDDGATSADGGSGGTSDTNVTSASSVSGAIFDVGSQDEGGDTGTDTEWDGPGSCRMSEIYGASGGYPAFNDPMYQAFLNKAVIIMTSHNRGNSADPVLRVFDISGDPPPPNMNYAAPMYIHPTWTATTFNGGIFGLTLDSYGNVYIAASSIYGGQTTAPGNIYKVDKDDASVSVFATLPNNSPAFGNINYDCVSETLRVTSHEDGRIWQLDMNGNVVSTYQHSTGDVTMGEPNDPGEPNGTFVPLGERIWAVQSHYGKIYYSVWWEDGGRQNAAQANELWTVEFDDSGIPDGTTAEMIAQIPGLNGANYSNPISDLSFASTGWILAAERTMYGDTSTSAHQSVTYELQQMNGSWIVVGYTYVVGELPNSSAGGVDHDFDEDGYVWMTGDALDFYTPNVVYGLQGTPYGGGDVTISTIIDHDGDIVNQYKTDLGDCEIPIPGDAMPPPAPPEG